MRRDSQTSLRVFEREIHGFSRHVGELRAISIELADSFGKVFDLWPFHHRDRAARGKIAASSFVSNATRGRPMAIASKAARGVGSPARGVASATSQRASFSKSGAP